MKEKHAMFEIYSYQNYTTGQQLNVISFNFLILQWFSLSEPYPKETNMCSSLSRYDNRY